jgi:hypothetical protein
VSDSLRTKIKILLDKLYGQHPTKPQSYFFEPVYEALPELEELDPKKVRQMVAMAFAQNEVDHASHAEETLRHLVDRVRHEANRSPDSRRAEIAPALSSTGGDYAAAISRVALIGSLSTLQSALRFASRGLT